jgi:hypothetical protein
MWRARALLVGRQPRAGERAAAVSRWAQTAPACACGLERGAVAELGGRAAREDAPRRAAPGARARERVRRGRAPIEWETPTGKPAMVNMELQLSAFFGYGKAAEDAYLGLQCHGVLWPAVTAEAPVHWPIAPPIVSGKVPRARPPCSG